VPCLKIAYRAQKSNFEKMVDRHEKSNGIIKIIPWK